MCTALSYITRDHYFGRNLDLNCAFLEAVVVTPRRFPFAFRRMGTMQEHFAMIGMASVVDGYPLYYDATNEHGLSMAGLNFPNNAHYPPQTAGKDNVSPFEFIPWVLGQSVSVMHARKLLERIHLASIPFSEALPLSPLHWIISDRHESITVESMADGLHIYDNPVGVLTNNPPFPYHMTHLCQYMTLSPESPESTVFEAAHLKPYSLGMGALGLPGDLSSPSRFVRAAYMKATSVCAEGESESVSQFFHLLGSVAHVRGSVAAKDGYEVTVYSSCCNTAKGIYYYTTYENCRITGVDLHAEDLGSCHLSVFPLRREADILMENSR